MVEKGAEMMEEVVMAAAAAAEAEASKVKVGNFKDADSFHRGSGQATIYATADGANLLRLENLDVTNGPALHVIHSPHEDPDRSEEVKTEGLRRPWRSEGQPRQPELPDTGRCGCVGLQKRRHLLQTIRRSLQRGHPGSAVTGGECKTFSFLA